MLFIDLEQIKPMVQHLFPALEEAREKVVGETDPDKRAALIDKFRPRWVAFRTAFDKFSHGKCWYTESKNPGTDDDIDHFRPKGGVVEEPSHPGYYWLAFEWTNLRLSCHRANRLRINSSTGATGGKGQHFPLLQGSVRACSPADLLTGEIPALFDPTNPLDPAMLSFLPNGEVDLSPAFKGSPVAESRFKASTTILHLNWPNFTDDRVTLYNQIDRLVARGTREAPQAVFAPPLSAAFVDAIRDLKTMISPSSEYAAAAKIYVESFRHVWWIRNIVLQAAS